MIGEFFRKGDQAFSRLLGAFQILGRILVRGGFVGAGVGQNFHYTKLLRAAKNKRARFAFTGEDRGKPNTCCDKHCAVSAAVTVIATCEVPAGNVAGFVRDDAFKLIWCFRFENKACVEEDVLAARYEGIYRQIVDDINVNAIGI